MKILGRPFVFPVLIHKTSTCYGSAPDLTVRWSKSLGGGTMRSTSYTLEICTQTRKWQWSFVWRPDVTRYYWSNGRPKASCKKSAPTSH